MVSWQDVCVMVSWRRRFRASPSDELAHRVRSRGTEGAELLDGHDVIFLAGGSRSSRCPSPTPRARRGVHGSGVLSQTTGPWLGVGAMRCWVPHDEQSSSQLRQTRRSTRREASPCRFAGRLAPAALAVVGAPRAGTLVQQRVVRVARRRRASAGRALPDSAPPERRGTP